MKRLVESLREQLAGAPEPGVALRDTPSKFITGEVQGKGAKHTSTVVRG